jgi:hypothetical protein
MVVVIPRKLEVAAMNAILRDTPDDEVYAELVSQYGRANVWGTASLLEHYEVVQFQAPYVLVRRRSDGLEGLMAFNHLPRYYYDFRPL